MEDENDPSNDISCSLLEIRTRQSKPIISSLLEIQQHKVLKEKSIEWISRLECLSIPREKSRKRPYAGDEEVVEVKPVLERCVTNPYKNFNERDYIAVSYVWTADADEQNSYGKYLVRSRVGDELEQSPVRDVVLDRVMKYAKHVGCSLFWLDGICIDQENKEEQSVAVQAMDLVYSLCQKAVAVIHRNIKSEREIEILSGVMRGSFPDSQNDAREALWLVDWLTSATWWKRAWTFQEDYKAATKMDFLISHERSLEQVKRSLKRSCDSIGIFGKIPGELCINSVKFRTQVTKFCRAFQEQVTPNQEDMTICDGILRRAGQYKILLSEKSLEGGKIIRKPMSPIIVAGIAAREITKPWDRLAIVANCCNYDVRLNEGKLEERGSSQSLALLTQHLLNGEIVFNDSSNRASMADNIRAFLEKCNLDSFISPIRTELTFIKSCRFPTVELRIGGIKTSGHLWRLGKTILAKCSTKLSYEDATKNGLDGRQRYRLKQLAHDLRVGVYGANYGSLSGNLVRYLKDEKSSKDGFVEQYKYWMASEVIYAMREQEKVLRLASLGEKSPYSGIFVCDESDEGLEYVFTAYRKSKGGPGEIDKHVSLGVGWLNPEDKNGLPKLIAKKWVNGLWFAGKKNKTEALFPWLESLTV